MGNGSGRTGSTGVVRNHQSQPNQRANTQPPTIEVDIYSGFLKKTVNEKDEEFSKNERGDFIKIIGFGGSPLTRHIALPRKMDSINIGRVVSRSIPKGLSYRWKILGIGLYGHKQITASDKFINIKTPDLSGINYNLEIVFESDVGSVSASVKYAEIGGSGGKGRGPVPDISLGTNIKLTVFVTCGKAIIPTNDVNKIKDGVNYYWLNQALDVSVPAATVLNENLSMMAGNNAHQNFIDVINDILIVDARNKIIQRDQVTQEKIIMHNLTSAIYNKVRTNNLNAAANGEIEGFSAFRGYTQTVFSTLVNLLARVSQL